MQFNLRNAVGIALLAAFAAGSWLWSRFEAAPQSGPLEPVTVPPGFYLTDAVMLGTDADGRVQYRLSAARAEELPEDQLLRFSDVELHYAPAEAVPWVVRATSAVGPADLARLELYGDVSLSSTSEGRDPLYIETTHLEFDPQLLIARSQQPVALRIGARQLSAVGMKAYLKDDRLELQSQVHGQFRR